MTIDIFTAFIIFAIFFGIVGVYPYIANGFWRDYIATCFTRREISR